MKMLEKYVDVENSIFSDRYKRSLDGSGKKVPFNEEADAVASVVHKIILTDKPSPRYYITKATYILGYFKRMLSSSWLDRILLRVG